MWQAQERALRDERVGAINASDATVVGQYRLVVRILRRPRIDPIPSDFSRRTGERIQTLAAWMDERFERQLQYTLIVALVIASVATLLNYGDKWRHEFTIPPALNIGSNADSIATWSIIVVACLALSWAIDRWRRHGGLM